VNSINEKDLRPTMATMLNATSEERVNRDSTEPVVRPSRRHRLAADEESASGTRFFLPKPGTNGNSLELDGEFASEGEARVEALKLGVTYYTVQEWRPVADFAGKNPELRRQAVTRSGAG
jgi:hypothetical protein